MRQTNDEGVTSAESREQTRQIERTSERRRRKDVKDDGRNRRQAGSTKSGRRPTCDVKTTKTTTVNRRQDGYRNKTSRRRQERDVKTTKTTTGTRRQDGDRNKTSRRRRRRQKRDVRTATGTRRRDGKSLEATSSVPSRSTGLF